MLTTKLFEVRDRLTYIPVLATKLNSQYRCEQKHLNELGFSTGEHVHVSFVNGYNCEYDPYKWGQNPRTLFQAHLYIEQHWDELPSGSIIDVEYILGETTKPKESNVND